jgi:hypothetical protein
MTKRELGACSLVCRFWARRCRYWIFTSISLRSKQDFDSFLSLIDSEIEVAGIPALAECIQELEVSHTGPWEVPWFHHMLHELRVRDIDIDPDSISLEVKEAYVQDGELATSLIKYAPRSLSTSLPRTIPRSLYSHGVLNLSDLRFRGVRELQRLIDDQADLSTIAWKRISFDQATILPPPRIHTRRTWGTMETIAISEWSDLDLEVGVMFLVAAEKVPATLAAPPSTWDAMARAAVSSMLPCNTRMVLSFRGDGELGFRQASCSANRHLVALGITFETPGPGSGAVPTPTDSSTTHVLEFGLASATAHIPFPHLTCVRLWLRPYAAVAQLKDIKWDAFQEAILALEPAPTIEICAESREETAGAKEIFKWLLDAIPSRTVLARAQEQGRLSVRLALTDRWREWRHCDYLSITEVLREPAQYPVEGQTVTLKPGDVLELMLCPDEAAKRQLLQSILVGKAQARMPTVDPQSPDTT